VGCLVRAVTTNGDARRRISSPSQRQCSCVVGVCCTRACALRRAPFWGAWRLQRPRSPLRHRVWPRDVLPRECSRARRRDQTPFLVPRRPSVPLQLSRIPCYRPLPCALLRATVQVLRADASAMRVNAGAEGAWAAPKARRFCRMCAFAALNRRFSGSDRCGTSAGVAVAGRSHLWAHRDDVNGSFTSSSDGEEVR